MTDPSAPLSIIARDVSKTYLIYDRPQDRLKQMLWRGRRCFYREFQALRGMSFEVRAGEAVGVIGRNGAGKSTLLKLLCGTLSPTGGRCEVRGKVAALLELGTGFNPEFTGRENVYLNAAILGLEEAQVDERFDAIAAFADIGEFMEQPVKHYSSGMFLRLAFAVVAHVDADVLIIDEALAVGDVFFVQKCMRFIRGFRERGTLLFVSHSTESVLSLCDRALWLDRGALVRGGPAKEVCEGYTESFYTANPDQRPRAADEAGKNATAQPRAEAEPGDNDDDSKLGDYDQRLKFLNRTPLRNDIELFAFDPTQGRTAGDGGAGFDAVALEDTRERRLSWVVGGEVCTLVVRAVAQRELFGPIVGFYIKNRLGQFLFGDNTFLTTQNDPLHIVEGQGVTARFTFRMPILPPGDYSIDVAIAEGSQAQHATLEWRFDALSFKSHASSPQHGLIGIPMLRIGLEGEAVRDEAGR